MQAHGRKQVDVRALAWLDGEINHPENFKAERFDGKSWTLLPD